jgi:HEAT repeat protein
MRFFHNAAMKKRSRIGFALLLLAVVGGVMWLILRPSEPMYKGKPLSVWLEGYEPPFGGPINDARYAEADQAVRHIGTNAIPTLLHRLSAKDSPLTLRFVALARKQHVFQVNFRPASMLQQEGEDGFRALGAVGKDAVPELIRMFEQDHALEDRTLATQALGIIGPAAEEAVPMFVRSIGDANWGYRWLAVSGLGQIHARPEITVPALIKCLNDQDSRVRRLAPDAIGAFGSDAKLAVPDLLKLLADSDARVQKAAIEALKQIDPEAAAKARVK